MGFAEQAYQNISSGRLNEIDSYSNSFVLYSRENSEEFYDDPDPVEYNRISDTSTEFRAQTNLYQTLSVDKTYFIILAVVSTISSAFNAVSIYLISQKKRIRPVDFLVANLCFCTFFMCLTLLSVFSITHLFNMLTFSYFKQSICSLINFLKHFPGSLVTLSSFGICIERIRSLKTRSGRTGTTAIKDILFIWIISAIITFPVTFRTTHNSTTTTPVSISTICRRVPLFNSKFLDVLYELFKFFFLHILFSFYLLYELYLIRSKIKYLLGVNSVPGPRLQKKVCRVRFAFVYSIILSLMWVSSGTMQLFSRIWIWFTPNTISSPTATNSSKTFGYLMGTTFLYVLINPVVVFLSIQNMKIFRKLLYSPCCAKNTTTTTSRLDNARKRLGVKDLNNVDTLDDDDLDISRFATQQATTFSSSQESDESEKQSKDSVSKNLEQPHTSSSNPEAMNNTTVVITTPTVVVPVNTTTVEKS